ncbi:MAG: cytochrome d ubiquinol oxidase subunit II [Desulfobacterales bacterium]|nr:cytochrome d ubiquinol oxidase subunit II [Desulfobacterales bacterium]
MCIETVWFFIWGLLWAIFFITDGFDFGIGVLYPFLGKNETDKKIMINTLGPLWDGNEVWLITAGGVTFAAFPLLYAVMFSSFYSALMIILFALILRGVSFEFRGQIDNPKWHRVWDTCIFIGSAIPAILFGVAFANIFKGIPIDGNGLYHGDLLSLLNPYGILGGILFLVLFMQHGALWLCIKTEGEIQQKAVKTANAIWPLVLIVVAVFLVVSKFETKLYANYIETPYLFVIIAVTVAALIGIMIYLVKQDYMRAWISSAITIVGATFFGIIGLYPNMFPSNINKEFNITAFNASSSQLTLQIMLIVAIIFVPIVIGYQIWAYNLFKDKINKDNLIYF